jgi:AmmeMemoRadiSam system protein B
MKKIILLFAISSVIIISCNHKKSIDKKTNLRGLVDTVGFAHQSWQMDSIISRINNTQGDLLQNALKIADVNDNTQWKAIISPHDDYTYAGYSYLTGIKNIKAQTIIFFGVTHKARLLGLENQIIFDDYTSWRGPYGEIKPSSVREDIIKQLPKDIYQINDSMQEIEHSVEAILPFLQYYNHNIEFVSILVPYMSYDRMVEIARPLAQAIKKIAKQKNWKWGKDYTFIISTDAVHYGDKDWGTSELNFYGSDTAGYKKAVNHEHEIIKNSLTGELFQSKIKKFINHTTDTTNFKNGTWSWCGRYSVPMGLMTVYNLQILLDEKLNGTLLSYSTSIDHKHICVDDIKMGVTAPANIHHWVGYASIGYR